MRHNHQLLVEIIDDVLRRLPNKKTGIKPYELWNAIPTFRRAKRVDAYCFEERRSARSSRSAEWLDLQKNRDKQT
jgi:hypothetical protein